MSARFCGECGRELSPDSRFCSVCGAPNPESQAPAPAAPMTQPAFIAPPPPPPPPPPATLAAVTAPAWSATPPPAPVAAPPAPPAPPSRAPAPTAPTRRRTGLLVAVGVLVLAIVSGGLTVWLLSRGADDGPSADRAGGLTVMPASIDNGVSVLGEPGRTWTFEADDLVDGGSFAPIDPNSTDEFYTPTALAVGDTLVVAINDPNGDNEYLNIELVGLKPDGSPRWHEDGDEVGTACWAPGADHLLCTGEEAGLRMLDSDTGKVIGTSDFDLLWGLVPVILDDTLYVVGQGKDIDGDDFGDGVVIAALDPVTLRERWSTPVPGSTSWEISESYGSLYLDGDTVVATISDVSGDEHTVELSRDGTVLGVENHDSDVYVEGSWRIHGAYEEPVRVYQNDELILEAYGDLWYGRAGGHVVNGQIGIGQSLYDLGTGDVIWARDDLVAEYSTFAWSDDEEQVIFSGDDTTTALDATDGSTEWTYPRGFERRSETRDAFVFSESEPLQITTVDRSTGEETWSRDLSDLTGDPDNGEDYIDSEVFVVGASLAVIGWGKLRGYTDFPATKGSGGSGGSGDDDTAYVTACGAPPEFIPTASATAYGGVAITYRVKATCAGGQWLNHSQLSVPFVVSGYSYASGYFDFSGDPYWIPEDGEDLELVYPFENTQVPEPQIEQAIEDDGGSGNVVQVPCEPGPENTEGAVPSDPSYGADPDDPTTADGAPDESSDEDRDETALEALQRIADEDTGAVESLGTSWTAQLSSKKPGTADDGKIYDSYDDILALHLQHRARYPESLLVYSNDWAGSFGPSSQDYWVTLSGESEATTRPILRWCKDEGWGLGDCWAKRLQHSGDPDLNTDKNKPDDRNN